MVAAASRQVAPVGAPSPRRSPVVPTVPLPADHRDVLSTIAKALRNVPREAIHDPPELFVWLNRQARALERARDTPMQAAPSSPRPAVPTPALPSPPRALSARERAEAVFRAAPPPATGGTPATTSLEAALRSSAAALPRQRFVLDRKGRGIRVEVRRARDAGQMEMPL